DVINLVKMIQNSCNIVLRLVNDILDLSKLESGSATLNLKPVIISDFLLGILQGFQPLTLTKGISISQKVSSNPTILGDESKLTQVFINFLSNAVKFTPKGGSITVTVDQATDKDGKPMAKISIADTGIGIPKDKIPYLFEKFSALQRSGTAGEKGTGLGMSIAMELVNQHRGYIEVASEEGKGTTFTIFLPVA
ncbi:MAG: HAMP domain-containing histidine kinase, partial [Bacteroidia bacterium]|nr:HAMP domain-containing histidine kinase [Bacteroidia bacterium]